MRNGDSIKLLIFLMITFTVSWIKNLYLLLLIFIVLFALSIPLKTTKFLIGPLYFALLYLLIFFLFSDTSISYGIATALRMLDLSFISLLSFKFINLPRALGFSKKLSFLMISVLLNFRNMLSLKKDLETAYMSRVIHKLSWKAEISKLDVWLKFILNKLENYSKEAKDGIKARWIDL